MKYTATEETMKKRRQERLVYLNVFMHEDRLLDFLARDATHHLLTGWFLNSYWRTAWFCIKKAIDNSWMECQVSLQFWYWRHILRLNHKQIMERIDEKALSD